MRAAEPTPVRIESIDMLRGIAILLMTLDHTRYFFYRVVEDDNIPLATASGGIALFFTRWSAHLCMPLFVLLAGTAAFLHGAKCRAKLELSSFLILRGLALLLLDLTWMQWAGWSFDINLHEHAGMALWAIGWSMIVLAALVHLPHWAILTFGGMLVAGHNTLDTVTAGHGGAIDWLWRILHAGGTCEIAPGLLFRAHYPILPWMGLMAVGYTFGSVMLKESSTRRHWLQRLGINLAVIFFLLRFSNLYGDARPWTSQPTGFRTVLSMLDCTESPPSLCYLLMTIAPTALLLSWLDRARGEFLQPLCVLGRVPLFYCLLHLPLIHGLAVAVNLIRFDRADWLYGSSGARPPPDAGFSLPIVYLASAIAVAFLYPACQWFADFKQRRNNRWLRFL